MRVLQSISPMILFLVVCLALIFIGMQSGLERFITPEKGLGYALGIIGGSAMLLLLLYPARKRLSWLGPIGTVKAWFQIHMVLGIVGPLLVLFHANFRTGATNSNVALYCMLTVSGSGLIGRYFYARIHSEFYGRQASLVELRERIARLQQVSGTLAFVPDLAVQLQVVEAALLANFNSMPGLLRAPVVAARAMVARRRIAKHIRRAARAQEQGRTLVPERSRREVKAAREIAFRHIDAVRRVAELSTYERLFSLWHILHLPLFFMLLVAGTVHVIAVHVY
jgi:hypothetical protein